MTVILMIENPDAFIEDFARAGADMICVHQEVCRHLHRTLQLIEQHGCKPAVVINNPAIPLKHLIEILPMVHHVLVMSVNPGFRRPKNSSPSPLDKIAHARELREEMGLNFRIEVDGGVAHDTVASVVQAGADMLVAGSAVFAPRRFSPHRAQRPGATPHSPRSRPRFVIAPERTKKPVLGLK